MFNDGDEVKIDVKKITPQTYVKLENSNAAIES